MFRLYLLLVQLYVNNTKVTCCLRLETSLKDNDFSPYYPCIEAMNCLSPRGRWGRQILSFRLDKPLVPCQ